MYIDAIKGSFFFFMIFLLAALSIPGYGASSQLNLIITVSTFIFAILAGFFMARLNSRFEIIKEAASKEDAFTYSLGRAASLCNKNIYTSFAKTLDSYYRIIYDFYDGTGAYKRTDIHLQNMYKILSTNKKKISAVLSTRLLELLDTLEQVRNQQSVILSDKLRTSQWGVLVILAGVIIFSLFYSMETTFFSLIITVLLSTSLVLVILIMRDLQSLKLGGTYILIESGQEVFESLGLLRYYNKHVVDRGEMRIPKDLTKYRLGLHVPGEKEKIVVVKL
jgi:hypothetical protein